PVARAYYWHRFYSHQPDLNFASAHVRRELLRIIDFWMKLGIDGLRLDAVPYLYEREGTNCENLPETHAFLREVRAHLDKRYCGRVLLAEANQWMEDAAAYFGKGDECHLAFHFPLMPRLFMALQMEERHPVADLLEHAPPLPAGAQWALFLRNHDELTLEMVTDEERDYMYRVFARDPRARINLGIRRRLAPLLDNNRRKIELLHFVLLSLPGTPVLYYGDEIGMGDNIYLGDRNGVRTPMQWSPDRNAGFSRANPQQLYLPVNIDPEYHYETVNVENQERNPTSLLWWMRRVLAMRARLGVFGRGELCLLHPANPRVLAFLRTHEQRHLLVVVNLSRFAQPAALDLAAYAGWTPVEVFGQTAFPVVTAAAYDWTLAPHAYHWCELRPPGTAGITAAVNTAVCLRGSLATILTGQRRELEEHVVPAWMAGARWFAGKGRPLVRVRLAEQLRLESEGEQAALVLLDAQYADGGKERYALLLAIAAPAAVAQLRQHAPQAILAVCVTDAGEGALVDGMHLPVWPRALVRLISERRKVTGAAGTLLGIPGRVLRELLSAGALPAPVVLTAQQSNTSVVFGQTLLFKQFRRIEAGTNPEVEVGRALTERSQYAAVAPFAGELRYRTAEGTEQTLALLQGFVAHQENGWDYALAAVRDYLDSILTLVADEPPRRLRSALPEADEDYPWLQQFFREVAGEGFTALLERLGARTAALHGALAGIDDEAFRPESFTQHYQRALLQASLGQQKQVYRLLRARRETLPAEARHDAIALLGAENRLRERLTALTATLPPALKIRIHGDYHLGQVLYTGRDVVIIDFEGEPARIASERRLKRSPLRDVAGMLRSFRYAAAAGLRAHPLAGVVGHGRLQPWLDAWGDYAGAVFVRAYCEAPEVRSLIPAAAADCRCLLEWFLLDKALYEVSYELHSRPDWVAIPLAGLRELLQLPAPAPTGEQ
ncbi:MAG TPA: putative maltokinase, partial [bacterium]|nr:putative maltokinase [bacterium]